MGKKSNSVFFFPKLSLSLICFGPSAVLLDKVKSGALVPTVSGINKSSGLNLSGEKLSIRSRSAGSKILLPPHHGTVLVAYHDCAVRCPGDWRGRRRIHRRQTNDRRRSRRVGEFAWKHRRHVGETDHRAVDDRYFPGDRPAAILSSWTELTESSK